VASLGAKGGGRWESKSETGTRLGTRVCSLMCKCNMAGGSLK
jgi:hypothetical protein